MNYSTNNADKITSIADVLEQRILKYIRLGRIDQLATAYYVLWTMVDKLNANLPLFFEHLVRSMKAGFDTENPKIHFHSSELFFKVVQHSDVDTKDRLVKFLDYFITMATADEENRVRECGLRGLFALLDLMSLTGKFFRTIAPQIIEALLMNIDPKSFEPIIAWKSPPEPTLPSYDWAKQSSLYRIFRHGAPGYPVLSKAFFKPHVSFAANGQAFRRSSTMSGKFSSGSPLIGKKNVKKSAISQSSNAAPIPTSSSTATSSSPNITGTSVESTDSKLLTSSHQTEENSNPSVSKNDSGSTDSSLLQPDTNNQKAQSQSLSSKSNSSSHDRNKINKRNSQQFTHSQPSTETASSSTSVAMKKLSTSGTIIQVEETSRHDLALKTLEKLLQSSKTSSSLTFLFHLIVRYIDENNFWSPEKPFGLYMIRFFAIHSHRDFRSLTLKLLVEYINSVQRRLSSEYDSQNTSIFVSASKTLDIETLKSQQVVVNRAATLFLGVADLSTNFLSMFTLNPLMIFDQLLRNFSENFIVLNGVTFTLRCNPDENTTRELMKTLHLFQIFSASFLLAVKSLSLNWKSNNHLSHQIQGLCYLLSHLPTLDGKNNEYRMSTTGMALQQQSTQFALAATRLHFLLASDLCFDSLVPLKDLNFFVSFPPEIVENLLPQLSSSSPLYIHSITLGILRKVVVYFADSLAYDIFTKQTCPEYHVVFSRLKPSLELFRGSLTQFFLYHSSSTQDIIQSSFKTIYLICTSFYEETWVYLDILFEIQDRLYDQFFSGSNESSLNKPNSSTSSLPPGSTPPVKSTRVPTGLVKTLSSDIPFSANHTTFTFFQKSFRKFLASIASTFLAISDIPILASKTNKIRRSLYYQQIFSNIWKRNDLTESSSLISFYSKVFNKPVPFFLEKPDGSVTPLKAKKHPRLKPHLRSLSFQWNTQTSQKSPSSSISSAVLSSAPIESALKMVQIVSNLITPSTNTINGELPSTNLSLSTKQLFPTPLEFEPSLSFSPSELLPHANSVGKSLLPSQGFPDLEESYSDLPTGKEVLVLEPCDTSRDNALCELDDMLLSVDL